VVLIGLGVAILIGVVVGGVAARRFLSAASSTPTTFVIYFTQPPSATELQALAKRVAATPGVESVEYLDQTKALDSYKQEKAARPADFVPEGSSPGPLLGGLRVTTVRPWNASAGRQAVLVVERDPAFRGVLGVPAPPGGWIIPPR
jgi:hypothetical protein